MHTDAETIGFAKRVIELLKKERDALKRGGLDVDYMVATLGGLLEQAVATEAAQEAAKRQAQATTDSWLALKRSTWVTSSSFLDMAMGSVSKDSDAAKNMRAMRSKMRQHPDEAGSPIVNPVPTPVKG